MQGSQKEEEKKDQILNEFKIGYECNTYPLLHNGTEMRMMNIGLKNRNEKSNSNGYQER